MMAFIRGGKQVDLFYAALVQEHRVVLLIRRLLLPGLLAQ